MEVLAVGPGKYDPKGRFRPTEVKVGQIVYLPGAGGSCPDLEDSRGLWATEDDIGFVVSGDDVPLKNNHRQPRFNA